MAKNIDQKLAALYQEYVNRNEEAKFIDMLEFIIAESPVTYTRKQEAEMNKAREKAERNELRKKVQELKDDMTVEERIDFLNMPYQDVPDSLKDDKLVVYPQEYNFNRFANPYIGIQRETFGARLIRYMDDHGFVTTEPDTGRAKLNLERFAKVCNEFAVKYDTKARKGHRPQKTRVTPLDLNSYVNWNICPKIDKLTVIAEAMNCDIRYLSGYNVGNPNSEDPTSILPDGTKYKKKRTNSVA